MAKISELADGGNLLNDDELIVLRAGGNVRATVANLPEVDSSGNMDFADNAKATFGTGNDLEIYHDGGNSRIREVGTGSLLIDAESLYLRNTAGDSYFQGLNGGAANVFYNGGVKLATTSTGIDVSGTATMDGLTVDGSATIGNTYDWTFDDSTLGAGASLSTNTTVHFGTTGNNSLNVYTNDVSRLKVGNNGDISFYDSAGSDAKFFWDASTERLGIGNLSPTTALDVTGTATVDGITVGNSVAPIVTLEETGVGTFYQVVDGNAFSIRNNSLSVNSLKINSNNSVQFYDDTGTTPKFFWDASAESLGIGTTSPTAILEVSKAGISAPRITSSDGLGDAVQRFYSGSTYKGQIGWDQSADVLGLYGAGGSGVPNLAIDSAGNVGIGTDSPANTQGGLDVAGAILARGGVAANQTSAGGFDMSGNSLRIRSWGATAGSGVIDFRTGGGAGSVDSQAMRIDSSGNLLVGTDSILTASETTNTGFRVANTGGTVQVRDGGVAQYINRLTSDGDITAFQKNGLKVGSIGTAGSRVYISGPSASLHSGLIFTDNGSEGIIAPSTNAGAIANGTTDLGYSGGRFKNGHFSGNINANTFTAVDGVYIGGVGFANKLDDYEEGTWTPTLVGTTSGSATVTITTAQYTKIGNMVSVRGHIQADLSTHNIVGVVEIGGLPFTADSQAGAGIAGYQSLTSATPVVLRPVSIQLRLGKGDGNNVLNSDLLTASNALIFFEATYQTAF
jgi:hypothetical protein